MDGHNRFLELLDPSGQHGEEKYRLLRTKLVFYFRHRGCADPENLADEVVVRVVRRLSEGTPITTELPNFCYGVAARVAMETRKQPPMEEAGPDLPGGDTFGATERSLLVRQCLEKLGPEQRQMVREYFWGDRERMAQRLGMSPNALRVRIHRLISGARDAVLGKGGAAPPAGS